jgi:hypothetical protein
MKALVPILFLAFSAHAATAPTSPEVTTAVFEPPAAEFFKAEDKFAHPPEIIAPQFLFPFELRRHGGALVPAEVIVLVQLDGKGRAKTLKVLSSRHDIFTQSALDALKKAKWDSTREAWFYCRASYTLDE